MRKFALIAAAVAAVSIASPASADIVATSGVLALGAENVTFADQAAGLSVFGSAGGLANNVIVRGTTPLPVDLVLATGGEVQGSGADLTTATIAMTDGSLFTALVLDVDAVANGTIRFDVTEADNSLFQGTFSVTGSGQNLFTIFAINGQSMKDVTVTGLSGTTFSAIQNVRIGPVTGVPEPATWAMMLIGFAGIGLATRRRSAAALA
jgi:hypothetical protein